MFAFQDPVYFLLAAPLIAVGWRVARRRSTGGILFASVAGMPKHRLTWRIAVARSAPFAFLAALAALVVALARPQNRHDGDARTVDAVAIQMVLDVSGSMAEPAADARPRAGDDPAIPSRLDMVKGALAAFARQRPDDLIGLIAFGGYAMTRAPLTGDHEALLRCLAAVEVPGRSAMGEPVADREELMTAIGDALALACARLREANVKSKVIVLLTDGGSNAGDLDPATATMAAERLGIRVYTIGVGAAEPGPLPHGDEPADVALLKRMAGATGGAYFDAASPGDLAGVLDSIDAMEKTEVETFRYSRRRELYPLFLIPSLCLIVLSITANVAIGRRMV